MKHSETTTAFKLCGGNNNPVFTIGKSKVQWESVEYRDKIDKVLITRVVSPIEGGKRHAALMGLSVKSRYIDPDTPINLISK